MLWSRQSSLKRQASCFGVLGTDSKPLIESGDPVQDRNAGAKFVELYSASHTLEAREDGSQVLEVGSRQLAIPVPPGAGERQVALRQRRRCGRSHRPARRAQRVVSDPGLSCVCRRATRVLHAQSPTTIRCCTTPSCC